MATKEKKTLEIRIFGNSIKIVTDEEEEYVYKIVSFLNKKMEEISRNLKIASNTERMIVVALSITDELFKLKEKKDDSILEDVDYSGIISMIDSALSG